MDWIHEAAIKRLSQFSTVIVCETSDPRRIAQFLTFLKGDDVNKSYRGVFEVESNENIDMLMYDPWEGLLDLKKNTQVDTDDSGSIFGDGAMTLATALRKAETYLNRPPVEGRTVFVIKNVATRQDPLLQALRVWAVGSHLFKNHSTIFIFTNSVDAILDEFTKSLVAVIRIPPSTKMERDMIIAGVASNLSIDVNPRLSQVTSGLSLHDTESALLESYFEHNELSVQAIANFKAELVKRTGILTLEEPTHGFEAIGGYEATKEFIRTEIIDILNNPAKVEAIGLRPPRGVLLFGPPGTGKTLFSESLAKMLGLPFVSLHIEDVMSKYVGESEHNLKQSIELIEEISPCVVFMDEIDRIGQRSSQQGDSGVGRRLFGSILEWLGSKDRKAIVVGATNEPADLDHAFLRSGRFDRKIPLLYPDADAREAILNVHTTIVRKVPLGDDVDLKAIAKRTNNYSGAELEDLTLRAGRLAFKERSEKVLGRHFEEALESFNIDHESRKKQIDRYIELAERFCDDKTFLSQLRETGYLPEDVDRVSLLKKS